MVRKFVATVILVALTASPVEAKDWVKRMFTSELTHDFGVVARGAAAEHRFSFENPFKEDVHIASVRSNCGCTAVRASQTLLKTYDTAEIIAELNTRQYKGYRQATLTITLDRPYPAEIQLHITALIRGDVVCEPGSVQFGTVPVGRSDTKQLFISYAGRPDWRLVDVAPSAPFLTGKFKEVGRSVDPALGGATKVDYELEVALKDNAPTGYFKEQIVLRTNDPDSRSAQVPVTVEGKISAPLTLTPSSLRLGAIAAGRTVSRNLVIQGNRPFKVLSAEGPDDRFSFEAAPQAKSLHLVAMKFVAGNKPGKVAGKIRIATDLNNTELEASVDAQITAGDAGAESPPSLEGEWRPVAPSSGKRDASSDKNASEKAPRDKSLPERLSPDAATPKTASPEKSPLEKAKKAPADEKTSAGKASGGKTPDEKPLGEKTSPDKSSPLRPTPQRDAASARDKSPASVLDDLPNDEPAPAPSSNRRPTLLAPPPAMSPKSVLK